MSEIREKITQLESQLQMALNRITQLEIRMNGIPISKYPGVMPMTPGAPPHYPWPGPAYAVRMTDNTWDTK